MLTIKVFLASDGSTCNLQKDFPVYQGQFNNILLNLYVPTTLLAPNFTTYASPSETIITPFVAGTSVSVGCRTVARNGQYQESQKYYLRYVKTLVKDNVSYALFERKLPKEFTTFSGVGNNAPKLIFNVENLHFGTITNAVVGSSNDDLTLSDVNITTLSQAVPIISYDYLFTYSGELSSWTINGEATLLSKFGFSITSGTPVDNDKINLTITASGTTTTSIATTQTLSLDVLSSNAFYSEEPLETSELNEIYSAIQILTAALSNKQNKVDNGLSTTSKEVVGAINELKTEIATGEKHIGTYNYNASSVSDLPSDAQLLTFVRTIKGASYELRGGETVIVVQKIASITDKNYKYIYNGTSWGHYEIPTIQKALNGVAGIVEGTYNVGLTSNTLVDIQDGKINEIYVKQNNLYVALGNAFMPLSTGATKQYVKDYALPKQFNDILYFHTIDETNVINDNAITSADKVEILKTGMILGDNLLGSWNYTLNDITFELAKKNSIRYTLYVFSFIRNSVLRITTYINVSGTKTQANVTLYPLPQSDSSQIYTQPPITIDAVLSDLTHSYRLSSGDSIEVKLEMVTQSSGGSCRLFSTSNMPSSVWLLTNSIGLLTASVKQTTGDSTIDTISQKGITDFGTPTSIDLTNDETTISYDTTNGLVINSTVEDIRDSNDTLYYDMQIKIPLIAGQYISIDETESTEQLEIKAEIPFATNQVAGLIKANETYAYSSDENGNIYALVKTYTNYVSLDNKAFISKGTLDNVLAEQKSLKVTIW